MKREEFLLKLGIGIAASCAGCFSSCKKPTVEEEEPVIAPPLPKPLNIVIDLENELKQPGEVKVQQGVIVARLAAPHHTDSFTALQVACTHQGSAVAFFLTQNQFVCPTHGSVFSTTGTVVSGPAGTALKRYKLALSANLLTVSE